jgi:hypothetical protein
MRSAAASFDGGLHVANQFAPGFARGLMVRRIIAANVGFQHYDRPAVELGPVARSDVVTVALVLPEFFGNFGRRGGPAWFKGAFTALVVDGEAGGLCQQRAFEYSRRAHRQAPSARRAFKVRAGAQHLKCEHVAAARVAREAPERAALPSRPQASHP